MRYKSIDNSKLDMSVFRLEELVAAYGGYDILEYNDDDPQGSPETAVVAVERVFEDLGLMNLKKWKEGWKLWKRRCHDLTMEQMTIIFYRSLAEMKENYIAIMEPENERDIKKIEMINESLQKDRTIIANLVDKTGEPPAAYNYFADNRKDVDMTLLNIIEKSANELRSWGITAISTTQAVDYILMIMMHEHRHIPWEFRIAMTELTNSIEIIDYIDYKCKIHNCSLGKIIKRIPCSSKVLIEKKESENVEIQKLISQINKAKKKIEVYRKSEENNLNEKKRIKKVISLLHHTIECTERTTKLRKNLIKTLLRPNSRLNKAYDLNNEEEMDFYLSWFRIGQRKISTKDANNVAAKISDMKKKELFMTKIELLNEMVDRGKNLSSFIFHKGSETYSNNTMSRIMSGVYDKIERFKIKYSLLLYILKYI